MDDGLGIKIVAMFAGAMPKEELVDSLEDSIQKWKANPSNENWDHLSMQCTFIPIKDMQEIRGGGPQAAMSLLKDIDKIENARKIADRMEGKNEQ